jgi:hypothetical protein
MAQNVDLSSWFWKLEVQLKVSVELVISGGSEESSLCSFSASSGYWHSLVSLCSYADPCHPCLHNHMVILNFHSLLTTVITDLGLTLIPYDFILTLFPVRVPLTGTGDTFI